MQPSFVQKMAEMQERTQSDLALLMSPKVLRLPLEIQRYDDPFLPFGKAIVDATHDVVSAYVFDFAAYLRLGGAGAVALERTMAYVGDRAIKILHGPFVGPDYAEAVFENALNADAVTLANAEYAGAYVTQPNRGAFVVIRHDEGADNLPHSVGAYWVESGIFVQHGERELRLRLAGEDVLYAAHDESFAQAARRELEAMK